MTLIPLRAAAADAGPDNLDALRAWFATAALPEAPYRLGPHLLVSDPARQHEYLRARLAEGVVAQVRRALCWRLRLLRAFVEGQA